MVKKGRGDSGKQSTKIIYMDSQITYRAYALYKCILKFTFHKVNLQCYCIQNTRKDNIAVLGLVELLILPVMWDSPLYILVNKEATLDLKHGRIE